MRIRYLPLVLVAACWTGGLLAPPTTARSIAASGQSQGIVAASADADITLIKKRLIAQHIGGKYDDAESFLANQREDGSWSDIDYHDRSVKWDAHKHLDRLAEMAIAYRRGGTRMSPQMLTGIVAGLTYWYDVKPVSANWWWNEIGQQLPLQRILILMDGCVEPSLIEAGARYLYDPNSSVVPERQPTGQNLLWFAQEQFVRGVLRNFQQDVASAVAHYERVSSITTQEGIQPDFSFHQHGPQLYVGGYGMRALNDSLSIARVVAGTRFAYSKGKINVLSNYLFNGARYMVRGQMLDYGAIGREISRPGGGAEAVQLIGACRNLVAIEADKKTQCSALESHIMGVGAPYSFIGHKHFWNSDFTVHQRPAFYASVKMASPRTYGAESLNGENLKGYWTPFGVDYIVRRGDEYKDIFPLWDWAHLPGVTSPEEIPGIPGHVSQAQNRFVGGVSDGMYGASAMKLDIEGPTSIHAHKAWFFFDDEVVALGAGISSNATSWVSTTLNQSTLKGEVLVDGAPVSPGSTTLKEVSWVLHDGIAYVFPTKSSVELRTGDREGSWFGINTLESNKGTSRPLFALWVDHGEKPKNASYEYIVLPGVDASKLQQYVANNPIQVISNTTQAQGARQNSTGVTEVAFYSAGEIAVRPGLAVRVDQPCLLLLREDGASIEVAVSAPTGPPEVTVSFIHASGTKTTSFAIRNGPWLGESEVRKVLLQGAPQGADSISE